MAGQRTFPTKGVLRRPPLRPVDLLVGAGIIGLIYTAIHLGKSMDVRFLPSRASATINTDPSRLPYYAARSLMRMFIAFGCSVIFTFIYGTAAARLRRAEKVLIPLLDILQSIPILGFAFIAVRPFVALFPGSSLGLEASAIFTIFTSQAWNMTFSFYHSLITQPRDLDEASRVMRLTKWQRFWRLDVPSTMIGQVWNGMMSFGGGWFFLAASESITALGRTNALPGIGSYAFSALKQTNLPRIGLAILTMLVIVVAVNVFFWRPLTAWSERFRVEESEAAERHKSMVLDVLRRSSIPGLIGRPLRPIGEFLDRVTRPFGLAEFRLYSDPLRQRVGDFGFWSVISAAVAYGAWRGIVNVQHHLGFGAIPHVFLLGAVTFSRVVAVVAVSTLIWVPIGVWIGMNPKIARLAQPVVQILASFPAILLFPFATFFFLKYHVSLNFGGILLMALGSQWYILFNAIAGASQIPTDLREAMANFNVPRRLRWKKLIIPAIFPAYVTGGITASGGAWNAAIVAEIVTYGSSKLEATGLGSYITKAMNDQDGARMLAGIAIMSLYVVVVNRFFWRRLYRLAETRFSL